MRATVVVLAALVAVCAPVARGADKPGTAGQIVFRSNATTASPTST
jgi:hypothetical protein